MILGNAAADAVAEQLLASGERIRPVFEGLDLQWTLDDAAEYLMATPTMQALDETTAHRVVGLCDPDAITNPKPTPTVDGTSVTRDVG